MKNECNLHSNWTFGCLDKKHCDPPSPGNSRLSNISAGASGAGSLMALDEVPAIEQ